MNPRLLRNTLFGLLVLGFFYYAWRYILATSFVIDGTRYYVLFDDAMISMRYAYNLAHGNGLVWNIGERVQGFTNPLWVFYMALLHLLPLPPAQMSLPVQITGAALLAANLYFVRRIVEHFTGDLLAMLAAVAFTAFYAPLQLVWPARDGGQRADADRHRQRVDDPEERHGAIHPVAVRAAGSLHACCARTWRCPISSSWRRYALIQKQHRPKHLLWGLGLLVLFLGGQTARALPVLRPVASEHLLSEGERLALLAAHPARTVCAGLVHLLHQLGALPAAAGHLLLPARLEGQLCRWRSCWDRWPTASTWAAMPGRIMAAQIATSASPCRCSLPPSVVAVELLRQRAVGAFRTPGGRRSARGSHGSAVFVIALLNFNLLLGDWKSIERWDLARRPTTSPAATTTLQIALALRSTTTKPGASIAVVGAGTIPYLLPERPRPGYSGQDRSRSSHTRKVRTPMSIEDVPDMRPGHMKWDYARTFGELKPDVIVSIWPARTRRPRPT